VHASGKFCPHCGEKVLASGRFCTSCGNHLDGGDPEPQVHTGIDDADEALKYAQWSFTGLIFPLVGWILAAQSRSKANKAVNSANRSARDRAQRAKALANASVFLSLVAVAFWGYAGYQAQQQSRQAQEAQQQRDNALQQAQQENLQAQEKQKLLQDCINSANSQWDPYITGGPGDGAMQSQKQLAIDRCNSSYGQ
jgi:hypothetical protein